MKSYTLILNWFIAGMPTNRIYKDRLNVCVYIHTIARYKYTCFCVNFRALKTFKAFGK